MRQIEQVLAGFVISLALCASAAAQQATVPATQPPAEDPDQIICKTSPPPTGTRLGGGRECHTKREWDDQQKLNQQALQDAQTKGLEGNPGGR